ncbi:Protein EDS1L [Clarias magur]|uniref:Protein EDS1L n=1 Tax=Clarias magur TaxID=1594786 RepID=A0A8J4WSU0_CLAMG|nr:Protein EDS1L [Clarias magur]
MWVGIRAQAVPRLTLTGKANVEVSCLFVLGELDSSAGFLLSMSPHITSYLGVQPAAGHRRPPDKQTDEASA